MSRNSDQAPPRPDLYGDPANWVYKVEAIKPGILGRYRVYLSIGIMRRGGNDGWGWGTWTLAGAHRKGRRELAKYRRRKARLAERQKRSDMHLSPERGRK